MELTEENIIELQRKQFKAINKQKKRDLEKKIYEEADLIDKIKILLRRFIEHRLYNECDN